MGTIVVDYTPQSLAEALKLPPGILPESFEYDQPRDCWHVNINDIRSDERWHAHVVVTKHQNGSETRRLMRRF